MSQPQSFSAVQAVIAEAERSGVTLWVDEDSLQFRSASGDIAPSLLAGIHSHTDRLKARLSRPEFKRTESGPESLHYPHLWLDYWHEIEANLSQANQTHVVCKLTGNLSPERLRAAFATIYGRHELLRARLSLEGGVLRIDFAPEGELPFEIVDLTTSGEGERIKRAEEIIERAIWTRFAGTVFRACAVKLSARDYVVAFVVYHFVADFTSCNILARELAMALADSDQAKARLLRKPLQCRDYLSGLFAWLSGPGPKIRLAYWRQAMAGAGRTSMPAHCEAASAVHALDSVPIQLDESLRAAVGRVAADLRVTAAEVVFAAHFIAMSHLTGVDDLVAMAIQSGRADPALMEVIANTVNCLPVRVLLSRDMTFAEVIRRVQSVYFLAEENWVPWSLLIRTLRQSGLSCVAPIVNFITGKAGVEQPPSSFLNSESTAVAGLKIRRPLETGSVDWKSHQLDLFDNGRTMSGTLKYSPLNYHKATFEALRDVFVECLQKMACDPAARWSGSC